MLRADLAEDRLVGGDREVAERGEHVAAADGVAGHAAITGLGTSRISDCSSSIGMPLVPRPS